MNCGRCGLGFADPMRSLGTDWYEGKVAYSDWMPAGADEILTDVYDSRRRRRRGRSELGPNHELFLRRRPGAGGDLLDVGCGEGLFLRFAEDAGYTVTGIDVDAEAIEAARRFYGVHAVRTATLEDFLGSVGTPRFDVVSMFEVIEHLEDPRHALEEVRRALRPGGVVVLSVPNRLRKRADADPSDWPPNHLTRWTPPALAKLLTAAGFELRLLSARKTQPLGFYETGWLLPGRASMLLQRFVDSPSVRRLGSHVPYGVRVASRALWYVLVPYYALARTPSSGIYAEAIRT